MDDKTIRAAMLGDREAARQCTEAGRMIPCPRCGGTARIDDWNTDGLFTPYCGVVRGCFRPDAAFGTLEAAIEWWNTRAPLPEGSNEALGIVAELREMDRRTVRKGETTHFYDPADEATWEDILLKLALIEDAVEGCQQATSKLSGWIPCSERMPEQGERVIACWGGVVGEAYTNVNGEFCRNGLEVHCQFDGDVTHWMPLPQPPEVSP